MSKAKVLTVAGVSLVLVSSALAANFLLTKTGETNSTITFSYPAQTGADGYRYYAPGQISGTACSGTRVSRSFDPSKLSVRFSKVTGGKYCVEAIVFSPIGAAQYPVVGPPPPDTTVPVVSVTAPVDGSTVSGTISVQANAADNIGVTRVDFYRDFAVIGTDTTAPYAVSDNTTSLTNGPHGYGARAYDAAGNEGLASAVHITVANGTTVAQCADGIDNDGDGAVDLADPGCTSPADNDETNTVPTGCATNTPNVPDGPDGMGGCFPGPSNTGPNAPQSSMAAYTGPCTFDTPNVIIDSKVINCSIRIGPNASGLVISNSYLYGAVQQYSGSASFTVRDTYMKGTQGSLGSGYDCTDCGFEGDNFTVLRTEVEGTNRASWCQNTCFVKDNYFHTSDNLDPSGGAHASGMRMEQNGQIIHNTLGCRFDGPYSNGDTGCSADISGYPDFVQIHHNTLDGNLFLGGQTGNNIGFCAYGGATNGKPYSNDPLNATYIVFRNNVFQRGASGKCGQFGPITDFNSSRTGNVWQNNKYDNGTVVNP